MIILEAIYILVCVGLAKYNANRIKASQIVSHPLNGAIHLLYWSIAFLYLKNWTVIIFPFIGRLFFDCALNLMRGLDPGYVPDNPISKVDKIEKKIFGEDGIAPKLLYAVIIIGVNLYLWLLL